MTGITNSGKVLNMDKITMCSSEYKSFKNAMNGVVAANAMHNRFKRYKPECATSLPTLGGRVKSRRNRNKGKKHTRRSRK